MGRSFEMQGVIDKVTSTGEIKVLREYADFLITHFYRPSKVEYEIWTFVDRPDNYKLWIIRRISEDDLLACLHNPEKRKAMLNNIKYGGVKMPYNEESVKKYLARDNVVVLAEGKDFMALKTYNGGYDEYYIEAPMFGQSAMEDSHPWSKQITKEQAMQFMNNYNLASQYYQKVRYNK